MVKTILMPFDGSELAVHALPYAAALARSTQGRLVLTYALAPWELSFDAPGRMYAAAAELRQAGIEATTHLSPSSVGNPGRAILSVAGEVNADLVVMGTHAYGTVGRALFGSVADDVVRHATVPVLVCTAQAHRQWPEERPRRLLVPLDGSALAETALAPAHQLALGLDASIDLVGVVDVANVAVGTTATPLDAWLETLVAETRRYLERVAAALREQQAVVDVQVRVGVPEHVITQLADALLSDIIVMASHGRSGVARMLLGSVALQVVQRSAVPVLLVQPATVTAARAALRPVAPEEAPALRFSPSL